MRGLEEPRGERATLLNLAVMDVGALALGSEATDDVVYVSALGGAVLLFWQRDIMSDTSCINITTSSELDRP